MLRLDPVSKCLTHSVQLPPDVYDLAETLLTAHEKAEPLPPDDAAFILYGDDVIANGEVVDSGEIDALASELSAAIQTISNRTHIQRSTDGYTLDPLGQEPPQPEPIPLRKKPTTKKKPTKRKA